VKNSSELREFLIKQMTGVADGEIDVAVAKGVCNLSQQIYNTINIEIKMALANEKLENTTIKAVEFDAAKNN